jgi:hypothetical protein
VTDDTIPQDLREKARSSALTAVGMVCRNVVDQEDWSVEVDYVTEIIARAFHAERLATEARVREECADKVKSMADVASRIAALGWRGNPNMSGDDRDFMGPMQRRRHDERIAEALDYVAAALAANGPAAEPQQPTWEDWWTTPHDRLGGKRPCADTAGALELLAAIVHGLPA